MENRFWSTYVQTPEELNASRSLRFRDDNVQAWLDIIGLRDGMSVLEVGCGGGHFCHMVKKHLPHAHVTGLDLDDGHIAFAAARASELGLECDFIPGNASALPFADGSFDACYSYTVMNFCEPDAFVSEQYRVLRPGGRIAVLSVINHDPRPEPWLPEEGSEERELFDRLWAEAQNNELGRLRHYENDPARYFYYLEKYGFRDISASTLAVLAYAPDSADTTRELALQQIKGGRICALSSVNKARVLAPSALAASEFQRLINLLTQRFDDRVKRFENGERLWDFRISTVLAASGIKP